MNKTLVVYYSRTGFTRRVAQQLARALGADVDEIHDDRSRDGVLGYLRSIADAVRARPANITAAMHHPGNYDTVLIGTPVWAGHVSSPVRSYLQEYAAELDHYGLFCTYGGSGAERVLEEMEELAGRAPAATLALTDREIEAHDEAKPGRFVKTLQALPA